MRIVALTARWTVGLLGGLAVLACVAFLVATRALGYQPVAVYSGSMEPRIPVGALVLERVVPSASVRTGDVISFADPFDHTRVVTHRVVSIVAARTGTGYRTRGDANPVRDPWTLRLPRRVGRVHTVVPVVGYALVYAQTREVRTGLIGLAAVAMLVALLRRIWRPTRPAERAA